MIVAAGCYSQPSTSTELCLHGHTTYLTAYLLRLQIFRLHSFYQINTRVLVKLAITLRSLLITLCFRYAGRACRISPVAWDCCGSTLLMSKQFIRRLQMMYGLIFLCLDIRDPTVRWPTNCGFRWVPFHRLLHSSGLGFRSRRYFWSMEQ